MTPLQKMRGGGTVEYVASRGLGERVEWQGMIGTLIRYTHVVCKFRASSAQKASYQRGKSINVTRAMIV
jgi:hypothetical protein